MLEKIIALLNWQNWVVIPLAIIAAEALIVGWQGSSARILLRKSSSVTTDWLCWLWQFSRVNDIFLAGATVGIFALVEKHGYTLDFLSMLPEWSRAVIAFLLAELAAYWTHRALHVVPLLWEFHKVHHTATELNVMMTFRFHPMENLVWVLQGMLVFMLMGVGPAWYATFAIFYTVLGQLQHARLRWTFGPLGAFIISPTFHRLHHSTDPAEFNRNFGARITLWDRLFGTYSGRDIAFDAIGTGEVRSPYEEFMAPFLALFPRALRRLPSFSRPL